jgi:hypothetical protein
MLKRYVNVFTTLFYVFRFWILTLALTQCTTVPATIAASSPPGAAWRIVQAIPATGPQPEPALWSDGTTTVIVWPGDVSRPDINLFNVGSSGQLLALPLAAAPRQVTIYQMRGGVLQLLWLDWTPPGETRLVGAMLSADRTVERGPAVISNRPTAEYSAAITPSGDLLTLWVEAREGATSLYAQMIDNAGRPYPPIRLAVSARHPSAVYAPDGTLHVAWLESNAVRLWTIRYAAFPGGKLPGVSGTLGAADTAAVSPIESIPVGVIKLDSGEALESFALGLDSTHVYCLWDIVTVKAAHDPVGRLAGLAFPVGDVSDMHPIGSTTGGANADTSSLRWPTLPTAIGSSLQIGVTLGSRDDRGVWAVPATLTITPAGIGPAQPVITRPHDGSPADLIGKTAIAVDDSGGLRLVWSTFRADGASTIYYATNRP